MLKTWVSSIDRINSAACMDMWRLYCKYYGGTSKDIFQQDLYRKNWVLFLNDDEGNLCGFSTLEVSRQKIDGKAVQVVFSGDTIIHHQYWGEQTLPLSWCELVGRLKCAYPLIPLYWFLIVKGHRTYRYLNVFSKNYYPNRRYDIPSQTKVLLDKLAGDKFGEFYDQETNVVSFPQSHGYLKSQWEKGNLTKNPEVQFFIQKNPGYHQGDELVCLTELSENNLRSFALKGFQRGLELGPLDTNI